MFLQNFFPWTSFFLFQKCIFNWPHLQVNRENHRLAFHTWKHWSTMPTVRLPDRNCLIKMKLIRRITLLFRGHRTTMPFLKELLLIWKSRSSCWCSWKRGEIYEAFIVWYCWIRGTFGLRVQQNLQEARASTRPRWALGCVSPAKLNSEAALKWTLTTFKRGTSPHISGCVF